MKTVVNLGCDPDVTASGFCVLQKKPFGKWQICELKTLDLFDLVDEIKSNWEISKLNGDEIFTVYIESPWLNGSIHHVMKGNKHAGSIGQDVGANSEIGRQVEKFCIKHSIPYKLYRPNAKNPKWDAKKFKLITGYKGRSNQEMRDSVRAAWV